MVTTNTIRVWVRSLGEDCRIRVESVETAQWLIDRLTERDALPGLEYLDLQPTATGCVFRIPNAPDRSLAALERVLSQIPAVHLMLEPESV